MAKAQAKQPAPVEMDLNLMRPAPGQRVRVAPEEKRPPVEALAEQRARLGSAVMGFSGRAAELLRGRG